MGGIFSLLSIARDGIFAHAAALDVTGQNVAGATTPGYVRRTPQLEGLASGGVAMTSVTRSADRFAFAQLAEQESRLSAARARAGVLADVESVVAPSSDTIADRVDSLVDALHQLAAQPSDIAVRNAVLARADWVAHGFSETADALSAMRGELFARASDVAGELNDRLDRLAALDRGIVEAEARGESAAPLRDRRDETVREIAQRIGGRLIEGADGGMVLFGAGSVLYEGGVAAKLQVGVDPTGALTVTATRNGKVSDITKGVVDGTLGGILETRDKDIPQIGTMLDTFAYDVAATVNAIHMGGVGLDGVGGRPMFVTTLGAAGAAHAMAVDPSIQGHPEALAAAATAADLPGGNDVAVALARIGGLQLGAGGNVAERFASLANEVGLSRLNADGEQAMREDTVATSTALRESASGVSTDEEMIRLQQFQRGFEASMKVLTTANDLFDALMRL